MAMELNDLAAFVPLRVRVRLLHLIVLLHTMQSLSCEVSAWRRKTRMRNHAYGTLIVLMLAARC
jgi:hypothetical protein